jgi:hypothetical protein
MEHETLLDFVLRELDSRKGTWRALASEMSPENTDSYYSWLTKLAQRRIDNPGVIQVQKLADRFRQETQGRAA